MQNFKLTMKKYFFGSVACLLIFIMACGIGKRNPLEDVVKIKGDLYKGGTFKYNEPESFKTIFPHNITEVIGSRIAIQLYEGLVTLNSQSLSVEPCLAERWEIDSSTQNTVYTFYLRENVRFHDNPCFKDGNGRVVLASDFKYCFDKACEANPDNQSAWLFKNKVVGANDYYNESLKNNLLKGGVSGIVADDKNNTLSITLTKPIGSFLQMLAMPNAAVFPKEALDMYGQDLRINSVGTGPFILKPENIKEEEKIILTKNESYWDADTAGNALPYLNSIEISFVNEQKLALLEFKKGELDLLYKIAPEMYDNVIKKSKNGMKSLRPDYSAFKLQRSPILAIDYLGFQHKHEVFSNINVRKAFNYAVDRKKIVENVLNGVGIRGRYGIVPPAIADYNAKKVDGFRYSPDKAKKHLAEAGFPEGNAFPETTLQINTGGGINRQVAQAVKKMLEENLNIKINIQELAWPQHLDKLERGVAGFFRTGWIADYSDPENFFNLFLSEHIPAEGEKNYLNSTRYESQKYDSLYYDALSSYEKIDRYERYLKIDQMIIDDAIIMPLYYKEDYRLLQPYVKNFYQNPMEYRKFKEVFFALPKSNKI